MKIKKYLIIMFVIGIIGFLAYSITVNINHKKEVATRIKTIPKFSFNNMNKQIFSNKNTSNTKPKLFVYFNTDCEFCQAEATDIDNHLDKLNNVQILFISYENLIKIKTFAKNYKLINKTNIVFLQDKNYEFGPLFGAKGIPFMLLYSKNNQLIQKFKGTTKVTNILKALENDKQ